MVASGRPQFSADAHVGLFGNAGRRSYWAQLILRIENCRRIFFSYLESSRTSFSFSGEPSSLFLSCWELIIVPMLVPFGALRIA